MLVDIIHDCEAFKPWKAARCLPARAKNSTDTEKRGIGNLQVSKLLCVRDQRIKSSPRNRKQPGKYNKCSFAGNIEQGCYSSSVSCGIQQKNSISHGVYNFLKINKPSDIQLSENCLSGADTELVETEMTRSFSQT